MSPHCKLWYGMVLYFIWSYCMVQGVQVQLLFLISLWQALKKREMAKPSHFCQAHIWTFWYFDAWVYSLMIGMIFWGCFQIEWLLHLTWTEHSENPHKTSKHLRHPWISLRYPLTPPETPPRHLQTTQDACRYQQTPKDVNRHHQTLQDILKQHLAVSVVVCLCLLASFGVYWHP